MSREDATEFRTVLVEQCPQLPAVVVLKSADILMDIARRMEKRNVDACNYGLTPRQEKNEEKDQTRADAVARLLGVSLRFGGDPRGYALKVVFPSGRANTWGNDGWGVPAR